MRDHGTSMEIALTQLKAVLVELVQSKNVVSNGVRHRDCEDRSDVFGAICKEITETQLPRVVTFSNDCHDSLSFEVVSGRAIRLSEPVSGEFASGVDGFSFQSALTAEISKERVLALGNSFAARTKSLRIQSKVVAPPSNALEVDQCLTALWADHFAPIHSSSESSLIGFMQQCEQIAKAALVIEEDLPVFSYGSDEVLARLATLSNSALFESQRAEFAALSDSDAPGCIMYSNGPDASESVLFTFDGSLVGIVLFETSKLGDMYRLWGASHLP